VADIDLRDDTFQFRSGSDPRFSRAGARAPRRRSDADDADGAYTDDDVDPEALYAAEAAWSDAKAAPRPTRGSSDARATLTRAPPMSEDEFRQRQSARWAAERRAAAPRPGGSQEDDAPGSFGDGGGGGEEGEEEEADEDLADFRPRVLTRAAASTGAASFFAGVSWSELGASEEMCAALSAAGAARPSAIQASAWAALTALAPSTPHVLLADAAGSGKTLAYLAPLVAALRAGEAAGLPRAAPNSPHVLVLTPTAELAAQVLSVCRALSAGGAPFRAAAATGGRSARTQSATLDGGVEVLVGTPGRLAALAADGALALSGVRALVLDECDVLAGPHGDFEAAVTPLRAGAPPGARVVLVTATLPEETAEHLRRRLLGGAHAAPVLGRGLHRPAAGIEEHLVDCSGTGGGGEEGGGGGGGNPSWRQGFRRKTEALSRVLAGAPRAPTLVFCNTLDSCRAVENFLKRRDRRGAKYAVHAVHAAVDPGARQAAFAALAAPPRGAAPGPPPVVVATDRASRGLDCAGIRHVILFDFPRDASEYVRRVGRTGRGAGGTGRATLLVLGKQVRLAREIMARNARGDPVEALPRGAAQEDDGGRGA
jgi:ATP-dependent RNA helicase DDX18/HAS1